MFVCTERSWQGIGQQAPTQSGDRALAGCCRQPTLHMGRRICLSRSPRPRITWSTRPGSPSEIGSEAVHPRPHAVLVHGGVVAGWVEWDGLVVEAQLNELCSVRSMLARSDQIHSLHCSTRLAVSDFVCRSRRSNLIRDSARARPHWM